MIQKNTTWLQLYIVMYRYYYRKYKLWDLPIEKKKIRMFTDTVYLLINDSSKKIQKGEATEDLFFIFLDLHKVGFLSEEFILNKIGLDVHNPELYYKK